MSLPLIVLVHGELTEQRGGHGVGAVALLRFGEEGALDLRGAQCDIADDPSRNGIGDDIGARDRCGVIGPSVTAEPSVERLPARNRKDCGHPFRQEAEAASPLKCQRSQDGVRRASSASAGITSAGRLIQASNASQSLAGMVMMVRLSTSPSADSSALRRTKSLKLVCACSAAASRMARSSGLTRTLRIEVV